MSNKIAHNCEILSKIIKKNNAKKSLTEWEMTIIESYNSSLPKNFIDKYGREWYKDSKNWKELSYYIENNKSIPENFITKFKNHLGGPQFVCQTYQLSEDFIEKNIEWVDWDSVSCFQKLSEDFIRDYKDLVNWDYISVSQSISEDFAREFKDRVNFKKLSENDYRIESSTLSVEFIREFRDRLSWPHVIYNLYKNNEITVDFVKEFKKYIKIEELLDDYRRSPVQRKLLFDFINEYIMKT